MIQSFIICFREFLEIAIIISIILAATRGVSGRALWIGIGIGSGLVGAALVAVFANSISSAMEGVGQEIFNAAILSVAVAMIIWTVVWMQSHGRAIAQKMKQVGKAVSDGDVPLYSLAVVVSLAMWREGAEIVLFITGIISSSQESVISIMTGGIAGAGIAIVIGVGLYFGLVKLSSKHLFSVTGWLLILLACGMSAQIAGYLNAADILPALGQTWDSSRILSQDSVLGKILHAMLGYSERPSVIQLIFYALTMAIILSLLKLTKKVKI
jgi:high-affinity iron transporter